MEGRIVFIDGYCVLCNGLAKYILKHDKAKSISVASLQGETAFKTLPSSRLKNVDTVLYFREEVLHDKSTAALHVLSDIGGWRKLFKVFFVFPRVFRDWIYKGIATRRYRWFGKNESCQLPDDSTKTRVLD
ncbi:MAG: thiol-disulfide oxidoreductase DCC family protein [Flavobacteriales bacterium]